MKVYKDFGRVGVVMCAYNGERHIRQQVQSILNQTIALDEILILDDGGPQRTFSAISDIVSARSEIIRYVYDGRGLGHTQAFGTALVLSTCDWIFISDQDDFWFPGKVQSMLELVLENPGYSVYMNDAEVADGDLNSTGRSKLQQILAAGGDERDFVMGCCMLVNSRFLRRILPIHDDYTGHDNWIAAHADVVNARKIFPVVMQYYRRHGFNVTSHYGSSLRQMSKLRLLGLRVRKLYSGLGRSSAEFEYRQAIALGNGLSLQAECKVDVSESELWSAAVAKHAEYVKHLKVRKGIRKKVAPIRYITAFFLFLTGWYGFSMLGIRAAVLDAIAVDRVTGGDA
jgi:glycosyltransferase involved in cell wall biosynthesis